MQARFLRNYGMILVLFALAALFSLLTLKRQTPPARVAVAELVNRVSAQFSKSDVILIVGATNTDSATIARRVGDELENSGYANARVVVGAPRDLRLALDELAAKEQSLAAIVTAGDAVQWRLIEQIPADYPGSASFVLLTPQPRLRSDFLKPTNLLAIVDRIVVIAVIAVGMTMVIITAGIDLSVGSLIAVSAVIGATIMKQLGGLDAPAWVVATGFLAGTLSCGAVGAASGLVIARFKVAPFIITLSTMLMARGLAFLITGGHSIYQVPAAMPWLGQGRTLGIPNTVILLVVLYAAAHIFMAHTRLGRYIYAVGGNEEAARLSGVPIGWVLVFVYTVSGLAAGLGGCIQASQINTGTPSMGVMFELYVIAAVVVGGTSLAGGSGHVLGTLIGAFIISVIQNGMNILGIESYMQQVVLGAVILAAVLLDKVRSNSEISRFWRRDR
ncbi:MAG: ABC transporter permease [Pirellulales bacterium]